MNVARQGTVSENTAPAGDSDRAAPEPTGSDGPREHADRRFPPPLIAALALGVTLVVGIGIAGIITGGAGTAAAPAPPASVLATGPVPLVPVDAPKASSPQCAALLRALPASLSNARTPLKRRQLAAPAPPASAAWGGTTTQDPVVLRCGIERPPELTQSSELLEVSGVKWLQVTGDDAATWYAVDRAVPIALTLPGGVNTGPIQDISTAISATLTPVPVF